MSNSLQRALEPLHATEEAKRSLSAFLCAKLARRRRARTPLRYAVVACCAVFALAVGGYSLYQMPVSYISVEINPSVELGLNRSNRVVRVAAYNDDGALVLQNLQLKNKPYTQAIELLLVDETFAGYLSADALLSFTVVSDEEEMLLAGIQHCRGYDQAKTQCRGASTELMDAAHHNGLSMGKYQAYLELSQYEQNLAPEDCHHLSMRELRDRIGQYTDEQAIDEQYGGGHHDGGHGGKGRGH